MKALALTAAVMICGLAAAPAARAETAGVLKARCTGMTGIANASMCKTAVGGIVNGLRDDPAYCIPKDADNAANLPIVQKYLLAHPDESKLGSEEVVGKAMAQAYPCPAKP
jgi:hypothetical protein